MKPFGSFDKQCRQIAAELKAFNPSGVNPFERKPGPCRDCGAITKNDYLCDGCTRELADRRAAASTAA